MHHPPEPPAAAPHGAVAPAHPLSRNKVHARLQSAAQQMGFVLTAAELKRLESMSADGSLEAALANVPVQVRHQNV